VFKEECSRLPAVIFIALSMLLIVVCPHFASGQSDAADVGSDPVKLFQAGQDAHGRGDLTAALEFYEAAIKVRPEFPEAEYQRGTALFQLNRPAEAENAFRTAIKLREGWSQPHVMLANLLLRSGKQDEALSLFDRALQLEPGNNAALKAIASIPSEAGGARESGAALLRTLSKLTSSPDASSDAWLARGTLEQALGELPAAVKSYDRAIALDSSKAFSYFRRAELKAISKDLPGALEDARAGRKIDPSSVSGAILLADLFARVAKPREALAVLDSLSESAKKLPQVSSLRNTIEANNSDGPEARASLESLLEKDPNNAALLARLGSLYRIEDPARSLEYFKRAAKIDPSNADYALGYAAALVRARRFVEAIGLLNRVVEVEPDNFTAHANLATALYENKSYREALAQYDWLLKAKPELSVTYFFVATAHDYLREFPEALAAYEAFVAKADPAKNQLEIEKVNLRLPSLRNQIKRGEGVKRSERKN
jgi:tetratricopeptide (TPR) repeat protein